MNVVFRTDASLDIGSGHVMRCLTLATELSRQGSECHFICRAHPGNQVDRIRDRGFAVTVLPMEAVEGREDAQKAARLPPHSSWLEADWRSDADATRSALQSQRPDWLVADHYALDRKWERRVRPYCKWLMVIDDLADRMHECNLLLDQSLERAAADYAGLVSEHCRVLTGPRYALLRPEFAALRNVSLRRRASPVCRNLLITMGGVDRLNATGYVLSALMQCDLPQGCSVVVVMGRHAPWINEVRERAEALPWPCEVKIDPADIAGLMVASDLVIGAAGGSAWERCALGVPSLVIIAARNQQAVAASLEQAGAARVVGDVESIARALPSMLGTLAAGELANMSRAASEVCDGQGTGRVVDVLRTWDVQVRRMSEADLETVLRWRNHPDIRRWMYSSHEISPSEHREWYARAQEDRRRHLLIVEEAGIPFGFVQFTEKGSDGVAYWGFYTAPEAPRGSGRKLGLTALNYAFEKIGFCKVRGEAVASNELSTAFHHKLGFTDEGDSHHQSSEGAACQPVRCFSLQASDWCARH